MKHYMQDAATDLGVELPLTKLQFTAFMEEGVPRLRMKAAVTRHLLPVLLRMIEIPFPPRDDHDRRVLCLRCLCLMYEEFHSWGAGTFPQALRTLHVACAGSTSSWTAVAAVAPEAEASRNATRVRSDWEPCTVLVLR